MIRNEASGCQRSRNAKSFVASCKEEGLVVGIRPNEGKLVWSGSAETRPGANRRSVGESRQVFEGALHHAGDHVGFDAIVRNIVRSTVLAGRTNKKLAGGTRLDVKCN